ncbi:hypothetical protein ABT034_03480 [Streptomyces sp. NPDC002773]|uniref:hypothetical protein n=1 Tax=Streptomyces sp. NPDC002773 TaxID=3154430 RepID=UPI00331F63C8
MPPGLTSTLAAIGVGTDSTLLDEVVRAVGGSWSELNHLRRTADSTVDVSEMTDDEVRAALATQLQDPQTDVTVAWPADRVAAKMTVSQLLTAIDDLWYPAMDDVVIVQAESAGTTVVVLDHEEQLTATRLTA